MGRPESQLTPALLALGFWLGAGSLWREWSPCCWLTQKCSVQQLTPTRQESPLPLRALLCGFACLFCLPVLPRFLVRLDLTWLYRIEE